jgi:iron complex outermembrane recepter protein
MKLFAGCLLTVFIAVSYNSAIAQGVSSAIHGKIQIENSSPAEAATIVLLESKDSSVVKSTISNKNGLFNFNGLKAGNYLLFITKLNYTKTYSGPYLVDGKDKDAGIITLKIAATQLNEVTVTGKKDFVEVMKDKTVLNVEQNVMAAGGSLYDVLTTSPGVKLVNDEILYRGGQKALIAIDGKPVLLTGDELINFLKNYQSSSISQIELIDNPGGKYEASAGGGMINIILKKSRELGSNASITASGGIGQKYKSAIGFNYNLRTEKLNLYTSYGFQDNKTPHTIMNDRTILEGGQLYGFNLNYEADLKTVNNNFSIGADYQLTKGQSIGFLLNGFDNSITINKKNTTVISTNGLRDSSINTLSAINRDVNNISYNLNYNANLDKAGKSVITINADYSDYHRTSDENLQNDFFEATGQTGGNPIFYQDNSPSHIIIKSARLDFSQALSKSSHFDAGLKTSRVNSDNQIDFDQLLNGAYVPVADLTDHFIYNERIDAAYLQFQTKINKTSLSLSLRGENTTNSGLSVNPNHKTDSSYFNLFPIVQLSQELSKNNQLTVFYVRSINRPNYQDLNPFIGYVDQFYYSTGNPFLKPDYINTYEISDLVMNKYKVSLDIVKTDNYIGTVFEQDDVSKVYTNTKANLGTRYQYMIKFDVPVDVTRWWNVTSSIEAFHEKYVYSNDTVATKQTNGVTVTLNQTFKITPKLSLQWLNYYESPTYYIISQYKTLYYMDAGIAYSIFQNKGSLRLAASDIFNTHYNMYHTNYANLDITEKDKLGSRFVTATFTYHFGTSSARRRSNNNDEQRRLGGSSNEN